MRTSLITIFLLTSLSLGVASARQPAAEDAPPTRPRITSPSDLDPSQLAPPEAPVEAENKPPGDVQCAPAKCTPCRRPCRWRPVRFWRFRCR